MNLEKNSIILTVLQSLFVWRTDGYDQHEFTQNMYKEKRILTFPPN